MKVLEVKSYEEMSQRAAEIMAAQVILKPDCVLGLATGSTPIGAYSRLVEMCRRGVLDFSRVKTVNLDEYDGMSGTEEQSYRYFMNHHLFRHINIDENNTYVPCGLAEDARAEGERYDAKIRELGGIDLQLLGIGVDGHIGFNEPGDAFVAETHPVDLDASTIEANARFFESAKDVPLRAVTMGMRSIMQARKILLIASGENKEKVLREALFGPITPRNPASILQLHADLTVIFTKEVS